MRARYFVLFTARSWETQFPSNKWSSSRMFIVFRPSAVKSLSCLLIYSQSLCYSYMCRHTGMTRERFYFPTKRKFSVLNLAYSIAERQTPTQLKQLSIAAEQIVDVGRGKKQNVFSHVRLVVPCPSEKNFSQQSVFWFVDLFKFIPSESRLRFRCCTLSCSMILRNHPNRSRAHMEDKLNCIIIWPRNLFASMCSLRCLMHLNLSLSRCVLCKDKILGHKTHSSSIDRTVDMLAREKSRAFCDHWL